MPAPSDPTVVQENGVAAAELDFEELATGNGSAFGEPTSGNGAVPTTSELAEEEAPEAPPAPVDGAPIPLPPVGVKRQVRGRYRGAAVGWQLDLRVDVDGPRPTDRVSGDFFSTSGATTAYFGSFVVNAVSIVARRHADTPQQASFGRRPRSGEHLGARIEC